MFINEKFLLFCCYEADTKPVVLIVPRLLQGILTHLGQAVPLWKFP